MQFNWEEFMNTSNKIVVNCKTENEAIDFCKQMHEHGLKWKYGISYLKENYWNIYKERTCYLSNGMFGTADVSYSKEKGYKVLEWSDYMEKDPIDYLEYGYVVEFENSKFAMYMPSQKGDCFDHKEPMACLSINYYDKELKFYSGSKNNENEYNIKRIYGYTNCPYNTTEISYNNRPLIWERKEEVKKMTVSEICKELGYKVEIVAEEK